MKIRILDEAQSDLHEAAQFYEYQSGGLGTYFLDTLFSDIDSLVLYAGVHIKIDGYFRLLSKTFPYAIYYLLTDNTVNIYAILDCRKKPGRNIQELKQRRT
ncbi:MAG: type II toxin-antitoxin system RelE/ParE family toxin [Proteobacteria bacterium]|nr:type II toxin-antitoxin system RelE/ParE family toxin [Pseudomonadota bacterium]MBU1388672.1 type II toxin-antitoxin system RelE/ParE family toxin [Pseudomonadota bacterium]MBU1544859.1 type II toxin-antitoxin system RelE/ParE family toxin [Pseudomonadota bacterium]MBU2430929.1 type II toxin-antitoxin system RelE/ParE family toxin [Pseudomonadota bacterium]MBU2480222.1 type II toxin-antitoxin system RelE/ParE family toxin [Pseudomonadota bacterium]